MSASGGDSDFPVEIKGITTAVLCAHSEYKEWALMRREWLDANDDLVTCEDVMTHVLILTEDVSLTLVYMRGHVEVYNGQGGDMVPEEDEVTVGAFTIANLNDTDGDSVTDWDDSNVPGEEDMIKVVFKKPQPEDTADALSQEPLSWTPPGSAIPLMISVYGGPATKLWKSQDKSAGEETRIAIPFDELPLTLWLEGGGASSHLRDTGIFSSFTVGPDSEHENTTYDSARATFLDVTASVSSISEYWPQPGTVEYWSVANLNDSDDDGTVDKDDGYVNGDQDLISLTIDGPTYGVTSGYLQLDVTGAVTVWKYPTKNSAEGLSDGELSGSGLEWPLATTSWPKTVYLEGTQAGERTATITYHPESGGSVLLETISLVYFWAAVEWQAYDNGVDANEALDSCAMNGGKKTYPGKKNYDDPYAEDRRKVTVKVTVTPARDNTPVHFEVYDVDDNSDTDVPVDLTPDNFVPTGEDNRDIYGYDLNPWSTETDASGLAHAIFTVGMQPGDNYRIAALPLYADPILCRQEHVDLVGYPAALPGDYTCAFMPLTKMLTVWRKLHLEMDSMGAPYVTPGEHIFDGNAKLVGNSTNLTATVLTDTTKDWRPLGQLVGGTVDSDTGDTVPDEFEVVANAMDSLTAAANIYTGAGAGIDLLTYGTIGGPYEIVLDDPDPGDIPELDVQALLDAFGPCYIDVVQDLGQYCNPDVPFARHVGTADIDDIAGPHRQTSNMESPAFWIVYAMATYEAAVNLDLDPEYESGRAGENYGIEPEYALVHTETIRDGLICFGGLSLSEAQAQTLTELGVPPAMPGWQ